MTIKISVPRADRETMEIARRLAKAIYGDETDDDTKLVVVERK